VPGAQGRDRDAESAGDITRGEPLGHRAGSTIVGISISRPPRIA
jgi:hypothetical protein